MLLLRRFGDVLAVYQQPLAFLSVGYMYLYSLRIHVAYLYTMHCYYKLVSKES